MRPNCGIFEREKWSSRDCSTDVRGCLGVIGLTCVLNGCLVCIGPGMAVDFGFTK